MPVTGERRVSDGGGQGVQPGLGKKKKRGIIRRPLVARRTVLEWGAKTVPKKGGAATKHLGASCTTEGGETRKYTAPAGSSLRGKARVRAEKGTGFWTLPEHR